MFITLTGELSWQRPRRSAVDFFSKIALWATLSGLRGNVRTPSIACWKARGRLHIRHNWTFFAIFYGWDVISGNRSKSAFFEGWVTLSADFRGKEASPTNHCWCQSSRVMPFRIKISAVHYLVLSQSTRVTDRRTDRITTPKTALAYARAVKMSVGLLKLK